MFSQLETAHWYFGANAGLDFTSGKPIEDLNGQLVTSEGCSSISDSKGNLLFYTDGDDNTLNKNHLPLLNGDNLFGNNSSSQSAIIVPHPSKTNIYYIFTVDANDTEPWNIRGFHYSEVDMNLDNGLGGIPPDKKNINLLPKSSEKVTAVLHNNGKDFWIVTHFLDTYYAFLLDENGINPVPVTTKIGEEILHQDKENPNVYFYPCNGRGTIKFSPNGKHLAVAHLSNLKKYPKELDENTQDLIDYPNNGYAYGTNGVLELFDFDASTGKLSNRVILNNQASFYGVEFSSNSQFLYATEDYFDQTKLPLDLDYSSLTPISQKHIVAQYDLKANAISNSRYELPNSNFVFNISNDNFLSFTGARGTLQLALDNKIYHSVLNYNSLNIIESPNKEKDNADYNKEGLKLSNIALYGLPPFITSYFDGKTTIDGNLGFSNLCVFQNYKFEFTTEQIFNSIKWNFGDGTTSTELNPTKNYTQAGTYIVLVSVTKGNRTVNFSKSIEVHELPNPQNIEIIQCDDELQDGITTFINNSIESKIINNPDDFEIKYYSNKNDAELQQNEVSFPFRNTIPKEQILTVRVKNQNTNCINYSEINLKVNSLRQKLNDISLCDEFKDGKRTFDLTVQENEIKTLLNNPTDLKLTYFKTELDALRNSNPIQNPKTYINELSPTQTIFVRAFTSDECLGLFYFDLIINPLPKPEPKDVLICPDDKAILDAGNGFTQYQWNTGETTQTIEVSQVGTYKVTVWNEWNCSDFAEVQVIHRKLPKIEKIIIKDNSIEVIAKGENSLEYSLDKINWQTSRYFYDFSIGTYSVFVRDVNGCVSLERKFGILEVPNVITPNNDKKNDSWKIKGLKAYPGSLIKIYDRYGKNLVNFLTKEKNNINILRLIEPNVEEEILWNGTYLGRPVPSTSYWYEIHLTDGRILTGWLLVKNRD